MLFIETPIFTKQASGGLFTDEELKQLQQELLENPNKGDNLTRAEVRILRELVEN
jgi:hypothetical protein